MNQTRPTGTTIALIVTVLYGLGIGVLSVLDVPNIGIIAAVGAMALAAMWVLTALLRGRPTKT